MTPFQWTADHLRQITGGPLNQAPVIAVGTVRRFAPDLDLWDHWPVLDRDGAVADFHGRRLVVFLSAAVLDDPEARHDVARLRLFSVAGDDWTDLGPVFPDGFSPGSREWAGSAVVDRGTLHLYFTATGQGGETSPTFQQRLFASRAALASAPEGVTLGPWSQPVEMVRPDDRHYQSRHDGGQDLGTIKAFRDPYVFTDPETGADHMVFTGSSATAVSPWNGVVGYATREQNGWRLGPPIVLATGLNNELERPHVIQANGRWYLFWSTQSKVFAPGVTAPTGLYGLVADRLGGTWSPINGSGLIFANPASAPTQAYSWQVLPDLAVWSFADRVQAEGRPVSDSAVAFAGTPAPVLRLRLDSANACLVG